MYAYIPLRPEFFKPIFFLIFATKIDCGYSLQLPRRLLEALFCVMYTSLTHFHIAKLVYTSNHNQRLAGLLKYFLYLVLKSLSYPSEKHVRETFTPLNPILYRKKCSLHGYTLFPYF